MSMIRLAVLALLLLAAPFAQAQAAPSSPTETVLPPPASDPEVPNPTPPQPGSVSRFQRPQLTLGVVGGMSFQYLIETPFLSGGAELRIGALTRVVEVSARLRFLAGGSLAGLLLLQPSLTLGVMFPVDSRVRIGFDLTAPPLVRAMLIRYATHPDWGRALLAGIGFETSIDIIKGRGNRALFWVGTLGIDITTVIANGNQVVLGPNLWTGVGYRL